MVVVVGVVVVVDVGTVVVVDVGMVVVDEAVVVEVAVAGPTAMRKAARTMTDVSPRGHARRCQKRGDVFTASMYRVQI